MLETFRKDRRLYDIVLSGQVDIPTWTEIIGKDWRNSLLFLGALRAGGIEVSYEFWSAAIAVCAKRRWVEAVWLLGAMADSRVAPQLHNVRKAMSSCAKRGEWELVLQLYEEFVMRRGLTKIQFNLVLSACLRGSSWAQAMRLVGSMDRFQVQPNIVDFRTLATCCSKGSTWQSGLEVLASMDVEGIGVDVPSSMSVARTLMESSCWSRTLRLWHAVGAHRMEDEHHLTMAVTSLKRGGHWLGALWLLEEAASWRMAPAAQSQVTHNATLDACAKRSEWQVGLVLLDTMLLRRVPADETTYVSAANACHWGQAWEAALALATSLVALGLETTPYNVSVAISAAGLGSAWQAALQLAAGLAESRLEVDAKVREELVTALAWGEEWSRALALLAVESDEQVWRATAPQVVQACGRSQDANWRQGLQLFCALQRRRLEPNIASYGALIEGTVSSGAKDAWQQALRFGDMMGQQGLKASDMLYAILKPCSQMFEWAQALALYDRHVLQEGTIFSEWVVACDVALFACEQGALWEEALALLQDALQRGMEACAANYGPAMHACGRCSEWTTALELLADISAMGVERGTRLYTASIRSCSWSSQWTSAVRLLGAMRMTRVASDPMTLAAALDACDRAGAEGAAAQGRLEDDEELTAAAVGKGSVRGETPLEEEGLPGDSLPVLDLHGSSAGEAEWLAERWVKELLPRYYRQGAGRGGPGPRARRRVGLIVTGKGLHRTPPGQAASLESSVCAVLDRLNVVWKHVRRRGGEGGLTYGCLVVELQR